MGAGEARLLALTIARYKIVSYVNEDCVAAVKDGKKLTMLYFMDPVGYYVLVKRERPLVSRLTLPGMRILSPQVWDLARRRPPSFVGGHYCARAGVAGLCRRRAALALRRAWV